VEEKFMKIMILVKFFLFVELIFIFSFENIIAYIKKNEKPIVVVTCMYNNKDWVLKNLESIFMQKYSNRRAIIVDDGSTDGTADIIRDFIDKNNLQDVVTFIANEKRKRKLANLYKILYMCQDKEIVLLIDGDDWLAHDQVFAKINKAYDQSIYFTYGQYHNIPPEEAIKWGYSPKGYASAVPKKTQLAHAYRKGPFRFMHLRTFHGWLFKVLKLEDLLSETVPGYLGAPFPASNDLAMYFPMVEIAHFHIKFIPDILYTRNLYSDIVGFKVDRSIQIAAAHEIRKKKPYPAAQKPIYRNLDTYKNQPVAICILCEENLSEIEKTIDIIKKFYSHVASICILYIPNIYNTAIAKKLSNNFISFLPYDEKNTLKKTFSELLKKCTYHLLLMTQPFSENKYIDLAHAAYWLERTFAQSFYFTISTAQIPNKPSWLVELDEQVWAWKFKFSKGNWDTRNSTNTVLYRTRDLISFTARSTFKDIRDLDIELKTKLEQPSQIGLFYE
jgi:glycosyltransferase involved in cell wall biosynthesis